MESSQTNYSKGENLNIWKPRVAFPAIFVEYILLEIVKDSVEFSATYVEQAEYPLFAQGRAKNVFLSL